MSPIHDVIVVGAGPGGAATAHYLARQGLDVLLLDKSDFPRDKTCGDGLTPRALGVLQDMGLLDELNGRGFRVNGLELHTSAQQTISTTIPDQGDLPDYLMVVPRLVLDDLIRARAEASGAQFLSPVRVNGIDQETGHAVVRATHNGSPIRLQSRMVVLAVGASLKLLLKLGILTQTPRVILAARAYYEGLSGLSDRIQAHFDCVPLPGYGWVFPLSASRANIGVGFWKPFWPWQKPPASAATAMGPFLQNAKMRALLQGAQRLGPVKGYPLRIDFTSAPTYGERILLVGESAGLVSPLTGEGIDFALESGRLAAGFLGELFETGDFSLSAVASYDRMLRDHFQRLFIYLARIRRLYVNPLLLNRFAWAAESHPDLKRIFVQVMMSQVDAAGLVNLPAVRKVLLGV